MCWILFGPKFCGLQYQGKLHILILTKCDDSFIILNILFNECFNIENWTQNAGPRGKRSAGKQGLQVLWGCPRSPRGQGAV